MSEEYGFRTRYELLADVKAPQQMITPLNESLRITSEGNFKLRQELAELREAALAVVDYFEYPPSRVIERLRKVLG